jgi:hypothetical protein
MADGREHTFDPNPFAPANVVLPDSAIYTILNPPKLTLCTQASAVNRPAQTRLAPGAVTLAWCGS